jgi:hypothetical protein
MARFDLQMPEEFMEQIKRCATIEEILPQMIDEAMPILDKALKNNLEPHSGPDKELINSLVIHPAKRFKNGAWGATITATGTVKGKYYIRKRKLGERAKEAYRNYQKLLALEYGTSRGQRPTPVLDKTINDAEEGVIDKMQEVFEREVNRT